MKYNILIKYRNPLVNRDWEFLQNEDQTNVEYSSLDEAKKLVGDLIEGGRNPSEIRIVTVHPFSVNIR